MQSNIGIRLYKPSDRDEVRQISCDTADRGSPVESFFSDREIMADLLMRYYTDYEPQSLWIADYNGQAVGYLTGCLNSRRYSMVMNINIIPRVVIKAIFRGIFLHKEIWRLLIAGIRTWQYGALHVTRHISLERYPAHLHLNIQQGFRGRNIGKQLIDKFVEQVKKAGLQGIHLATREDNVPACRFFEKMGFVLLERYPVVLPFKSAFQTHYTIIYGMEVICLLDNKNLL